MKAIEALVEVCKEVGLETSAFHESHGGYTDILLLWRGRMLGQWSCRKAEIRSPMYLGDKAWHFGERVIDLHEPESLNMLKETLTAVKGRETLRWMWEHTRNLAFWTSILSIIICFFTAVSFDDPYKRHIASAGYADSPAIAARDIGLALKSFEIDKNNHYTSVFWDSPDENVKEWRDSLETWKTKFEATDMSEMGFDEGIATKEVMLREFRKEYLKYGGSSNLIVRAPAGLSTYPHNLVFSQWFGGSLMLLFFSLYWNRRWFQ